MLKRETQKQLMRDLLARGAPPDRPHSSSSTLAIGLTILFVSVALFWLTRT